MAAKLLQQISIERVADFQHLRRMKPGNRCLPKRHLPYEAMIRDSATEPNYENISNNNNPLEEVYDGVILFLVLSLVFKKKKQEEKSTIHLNCAQTFSEK